MFVWLPAVCRDTQIDIYAVLLPRQYYPQRVPDPFTLVGINKQVAKKPAATRN